MDIQNTQSPSPIAAPQDTAPPAPQPDGRATADAVATTTDPRPEIPLPLPASPSQTALVGKASLSTQDEAAKSKSVGTSEVQRTLKPYNISMLPEKLDAPAKDTPPEADFAATD